MNTPSFRILCGLITGGLLLTAPSLRAQVPAVNVDWLPLTDAERNLKAPLVDKDAGVEAIFWRVHVMDDIRGQEVERSLFHYVRLKVFTEKGKEKVSTIDIPYRENTAIMYVNGRTIKADGSIVELDSKSVFNREIARTGQLRRRVKSFAMPAVEPGAILEYRWKEIQSKPRVRYLRIQFQREFAVQKVTYFLRPLPSDYTTYRMAIWPFNCKPSPLKMENNGFDSTTLENVPAFKDEPMMPAEAEVRPWALVLYREQLKVEPDKYWDHFGKEAYRELKVSLKTNNDLKAAAVLASAGAKTDDEKLLGLVRWIRSNIRNMWSENVTDVERAKVLKQMPKERFRTSAEIFKSGIGNAYEMNIVFAAMAMELGFEARPAYVGDRDDIQFYKEMADAYFLGTIDMAVQVDGKWRFYDASAGTLPAGMLAWNEEGAPALITDPKKPFFVDVPLTGPDGSVRLRRGDFTLSEDGDLEGDISEIYTGHKASLERSGQMGKSDDKRREDMKEQFTHVFPQAEISKITVENIDETEKPVTYRYHVKIPAYAARTGKRILLQPLFFQRGDSPMFTATDRKHAVVFKYGWKEDDEVSIKLPAGYQLDNAENPGDMQFGKTGEYKLLMGIRNKDTLVCHRTLTFGREGALAFGVEVYPKLKLAFETVHQRDDQTIPLKLVANTAATK